MNKPVITEKNGCTVIEQRWFSYSYLVYLCLMVVVVSLFVWAGLASKVVRDILHLIKSPALFWEMFRALPFSQSFSRVMMLFVFIVLIGCLYYAVARMVNCTKIVASAQDIRSAHGPLPLYRSQKISVHAISAFVVIRRVERTSKTRNVFYKTCARTPKGDIMILPYFEDKTIHTFVGSSLASIYSVPLKEKM